MSRYLVKPKAGLWRAPIDEEWPRMSWEPPAANVSSPTIYEREAGSAVDTGVIDANGNAIYRDDTQPIGYLTRRK